MKRRRLISRMQLFWRKHHKILSPLFETVFWLSFVGTSGIFFAELLSEALGVSIILTRFFCVGMVISIRLALMEDFPKKGDK